MLPRLFGNDNAHPLFNGTIEQNGCGKMNDITSSVLHRIKGLGVTHVWYTGLLEHATCTDYSRYGIRRDHSAMVKGRAGSPYAIKDYYDVDPDLASSPEKRLDEFQALLRRTHTAGLGFIMDFVPNHVARQYHSDKKPEGTVDLGAEDNCEQAFSPFNNFYYIPGHPLRCQFDMKADEALPYQENPAKATGNDCFSSTPGRNDWYETVKLNYGVDYAGGRQGRFDPIPDTWHKMLQILLYWAGKGVDAFRCDMAEMVPCEFWHWAVSEVKRQYPEMLFIGEVYNPSLYREYLYRGHFDYLYDKVGLYDTLRAVTRGERPASDITYCWQSVGDIQMHMLNFLENHDEQRLASDFYAVNGSKGRAALLVSACMNTNPFMLYFGQELGERGMEHEGFSGLDGRTTIFDYWNVPVFIDWRRNGKYALSNLSAEQRRLYTYYKKLLGAVQSEPSLYEGRFFDLMYANYDNPSFDSTRIFAFIRQAGNDAVLAIANFSNAVQHVQVNIPAHAFDFLGIPRGGYSAKELLSGKSQTLSLEPDSPCSATLQPFDGILLKITY